MSIKVNFENGELELEGYEFIRLIRDKYEVPEKLIAELTFRSVDTVKAWAMPNRVSERARTIDPAALMLLKLRLTGGVNV